MTSDIVWDYTTMNLIVLKDLLSAHPSFIRCFDKAYRLNDAIKKEIIFKTKSGSDHFCAECVGMQGFGKSRVIQQIAQIISPITIDNIGFTTEDLLKKTDTIPKGSVLIQDEQTLGVGEGSEREKLEKNNLIEVTRKHGLSLFFVSPVTRNLMSVHYVFEVIQKNVKLRISKVAVKKNGVYLGYITVFIPEDKKDELYKAYLPLKDQFIEKILKRNLGRIDFTEKAELLMKHQDIKLCQKIGDIETLSMELCPSLTISEHQRIARKVKFLQLKNKPRPYKPMAQYVKEYFGNP